MSNYYNSETLLQLEKDKIVILEALASLTATMENVCIMAWCLEADFPALGEAKRVLKDMGVEGYV